MRRRQGWESEPGSAEWLITTLALGVFLAPFLIAIYSAIFN